MGETIITQVESINADDLEAELRKAQSISVDEYLKPSNLKALSNIMDTFIGAPTMDEATDIKEETINAADYETEVRRARSMSVDEYLKSVNLNNLANDAEAPINHTDQYIERAERGDANAQNSLGVCYYYGDGVSQDYELAAQWFKKAAKQGCVEAQHYMGVCHEHGKGVTQNHKWAVEWYKKAAEHGFAKSQYCLGVCYETGLGVEQDYELAAKFYKWAAKHGYVQAQYSMGVCYGNGVGVQRNIVTAAEWYGKAAKHGNADAQYSLGKCYANGDGVTQNYALAAEWFGKSAEQGKVEAQYCLGECYVDGNGVPQDSALSTKWFMLAAEQGNADAQYCLGKMYATGKDMPDDKAAYAMWVRKAAELGCVEAQHKLGVLYNCGQYVAHDTMLAVEWYRKAAEQGYAEAQYILGEVYTRGVSYCDVYANYDEASKWYAKAVEQGHTAATDKLRELARQGHKELQYALGVCYIKGAGLPKDYLVAVNWFRMAAVQNHAGARKFLEELAVRGFATAQFEMGRLHLLCRNVEFAFAMFEKAARQGHAPAFYELDKIAKQGDADLQYSLGVLYEDRKDSDRDIETAIEWYFMATGSAVHAAAWERLLALAGLGNVTAQYAVGLSYKNGRGVAKNEDLSVVWLTKAAQQGSFKALSELKSIGRNGNAGALYTLGIMYDIGQGVSQDTGEAVEWYYKAAEHGHAEALSVLIESSERGVASAQFALGRLYRQGSGVDRNLKLAVGMFEKAARQGHYLALDEFSVNAKRGSAAMKCTVGELYEGKRNIEEAIEWYRLAAKQASYTIARERLLELAKLNYASAQYAMGEVYEQGKGIERSQETAVSWYCKAAKHGDKKALQKLIDLSKRGLPSAQYALGKAYVDKNNTTASQWFAAAAQQGDALSLCKLKDLANSGIVEAKFSLGMLHDEGQGVVRDRELAADWYLKAANSGNTAAMSKLSTLVDYFRGEAEQNNPAAARKLIDMAERGLAEAQFALGQIYAEGQGVAQDYELAAKWHRSAATKGIVQAQFALGELYVNGWGVAQDYELALEWLRKAADLGHGAAENKLRELVEQGFVEMQNKLKELAQQGNINEQYELGELYYYGRNIEENLQSAVKWFKMAAGRGHQGAAVKLSEIVSHGFADEQLSLSELPKWQQIWALCAFEAPTFETTSDRLLRTSIVENITSKSMLTVLAETCRDKFVQKTAIKKLRAMSNTTTDT